MGKNKLLTPLLLLLLTATIGGATSPVNKLGLRAIPPISFVVGRFALAALVLLPFAWKDLRMLKLREVGRLTLFSLLSSANLILFAYGIKLTTAIVAQVLYVGVPVLTAMLVTVLGQEKLTRAKLAGIALGLIGGLTLIFLPVWEKGGVNTGSVVGNLLILVGVGCFTIYSVYSKKWLATYKPSVMTSIFTLTTLAVGLLFLPWEIAGTGGLWGQLKATDVASLVWVGTVGTGLFYWLYQYTIKRASATTASLVFYLLPIASVGWAYLLLGESPTLGFGLGAVLIFWGAWLAGHRN